MKLADIPQTNEDRAFSRADLEDGCRKGIYRKISRAHAERAKREGVVISSSFTVWKEGPDGWKGRFFVKLSRQSTHWPKGSPRMESLPEFAISIRKGDHFILFDIREGLSSLPVVSYDA